MTNQKCQNCSAPMTLIQNRDGTDSYKCAYCGAVINIRPKTVSDKVFTFINRAANALKDDGTSAMSPEKKTAYDERLAAINEKRQQAYDKYMEKRLKSYEKYIDKHLKNK